MPEKEWPTRTVGPFCRSSTCCAEATASGTPFPELHLPPCASGDERGRCAGKRSTRKSASVHHHDSLPSSQGLELGPPHMGQRNLTNVVRIIAPEWLAWLQLG